MSLRTPDQQSGGECFGHAGLVGGVVHRGLDGLFGVALRSQFKVDCRACHAGRHSVEFTEQWGQLLNYFVFFFFGTVVAGYWGHFTPAVLLYAVLSLTVVRVAPVALALLGTGLSRATVLFMGWFGPRGLASIVLALVYLEHEAGLAGNPTIRLAVMATVLLSIFAHGLTAQRGINLYARRIAALDETSPEHQVVGDDSPEPPQTPHVGT